MRAHLKQTKYSRRRALKSIVLLTTAQLVNEESESAQESAQVIAVPTEYNK
jgi:hypothetical protein